jgi:hypothetical protein
MLNVYVTTRPLVTVVVSGMFTVANWPVPLLGTLGALGREVDGDGCSMELDAPGRVRCGVLVAKGAGRKPRVATAAAFASEMEAEFAPADWPRPCSM